MTKTEGDCICDVFISYSTQDQTIANEVVSFLEKNGVKCWIAPRNIKSGKSYSAELIDALKSVKMVVLIFSHNSQNSTYVNNEIEVAFSENKPIITFKIEECMPQDRLEFFLKNSQWLDAYPNPKKYYKKLINDSKHIIEEQEKHDVYICYENTDKQTADAICHALEENNIKCWIKPRDLSVKHETEETMEAIKESKLVVLVYSNFSKNSNFINSEIDLAFSYNLPIFTVNIDNSKLDGGLEFFLKGQHWLDAYPNPSKEFKQLILDTSKILGKPLSQEIYEKPYKSKDKTDFISKNLKNKKIVIPIFLIIILVLGLIFIIGNDDNNSQITNGENTVVSTNNSSNTNSTQSGKTIIEITEIDSSDGYIWVWGHIINEPTNPTGYNLITEVYDANGNIIITDTQSLRDTSDGGEVILGGDQSSAQNFVKAKVKLVDSNQNVIAESNYG